MSEFNKSKLYLILTLQNYSVYLHIIKKLQMKKLTLILCLLMSLFLISCGGDKKPKETEYVTLEMTLVTNQKIQLIKNKLIAIDIYGRYIMEYQKNKNTIIYCTEEQFKTGYQNCS